MVFEVEGRTFNVLGISSVVAILTAGASSSVNPVLIGWALPVILVVSTMYCSFNAKVSAILRGYLAGIEEDLGKVNEGVSFMWNRGYMSLYHGKEFLTNDLIAPILAAIAAIGTSVSLYGLATSDVPLLVVLIYGILTFTCFVCFGFDLLTNSRTKRRALNYYRIAKTIPQDKNIWTWDKSIYSKVLDETSVDH